MPLFTKKRKPKPKSGRSWFGAARELVGGVVFMSLLIVAVGAVALTWFWNQRDQFLTTQLQSQLQKQFPSAAVTIERAQFDSRGRVLIANLEVRPTSDQAPILKVPATRVTIDRDLMLSERKVDVLAIDLNQPHLSLVRDGQGAWNWEAILGPQGDSAPLPQIRIRDATVSLQYQHPEFQRAIRLRVDALDTDLTPTAKHRYSFNGDGREESLGVTEFSGEFDLAHKTWQLSGRLGGLKIDQPLLEVAAMVSADARSVVDRFSGDTRTASLDGTPITNAKHTALELIADLEFHTSKQYDSEPEYSVVAQLVSGEIRHPELPVSLDQIRGSLAIDRLGVRIDDIAIRSGATSARVTGAWGWNGNSLPGHVSEKIDVELVAYRVTSDTRDFLPRSLQNVYDELRPRGIVSANFAMTRKPEGGVDFDLGRASITEGSVSHVMFAYPVHNVSGSISRSASITPEALFDLNFKGMAGDRPVSAVGKLLNPGPDSEVHITIKADSVPIDDQFYRALDSQQREVVSHLGLSGRGDVVCKVSRVPSVSRRPDIELDIDLIDAGLRLKSFPLQIRELAGHVHFDGHQWQMTKISGVHGPTQIRGFGTAKPVDGEWQVAMTLSAEQARFNETLRLALLETGSDVATRWDQLNPTGEFDMNLSLEWTSGGKVAVDIPLMNLKKCEFKPRAFPWRLSNVNGVVTVGRDGSVAFENVTAVHDQCLVSTSGSFVTLPEYWQLRFDKLDADDLLPDQQFRDAVPPQLAELLRTIQLNDPVSCSGQVEFKGNYAGDVVTAAWDMRLVVNQADLLLGVEVNDVSGSISFQGMVGRDGIATVPVGKLSIDSCWILGYHVTDLHGPFLVSPNEMIVGSPKMFDTGEAESEWTTVSREERLTGRVFDGELFLDLIVKRTEDQPYLLRTTLSRASLEQWAIESNYGQANIRGELNGYLDLAGDQVSSRQTIGNGRILISPAALYEVPVLFQMFQSLRFAPADDTAFRHAYAEFRVLDEKFLFDEIGLLGDTMSLFGQGFIRFDRTVDLDFVYRPPRRGGVNLASQVISRLENVLPILFTVEVDGTVDVPQIKVNSGVRETLRGFRRLLEQTPANIRPPKILPPPKLSFQQLSAPFRSAPVEPAN